MQVDSLEEAVQVDSLTQHAHAMQPPSEVTTVDVIIFYQRWNDINLMCSTADGRRAPTSELTGGPEFGFVECVRCYSCHVSH